MKPAYNPYSGGSPARAESAIPCGITVKATVTPATMSGMMKDFLYAGNHLVMGTFRWSSSMLQKLLNPCLAEATTFGHFSEKISGAEIVIEKT